METVTKRDLNQRTAAVLDRVGAEREIVVTERGVPKWRLSVYRAAETGLDRMHRAGVYTPAPAERLPWPAEPSGPQRSSAEVDELLEDMRGER